MLFESRYPAINMVVGACAHRSGMMGHFGTAFFVYFLAKFSL
jgi:hypothetical protein